VKLHSQCIKWGCRVLWKQNLDLEDEVKKLKGDIAKAEKILDTAASGVSWNMVAIVVVVADSTLP
jgi:hypothetical protein